MFDPSQKQTGTNYTTTVALLILAIIFSPALWLVSGPMGYPSLILALTGSASCAALAWVNWKKSSELTMPSIENPGARVK